MIASRIRLLLQDLNECNVDFVFRELTQFCEYGIEGSVLLLQTCLEHLYFHHSDLKNTHLEQVLVRIFRFLLDKPNFTTVFSQSLGSIEKQNCKELLEKLSHVFQLSLNEKFSMGLALCDSENLDTRMCAKKFCLSQIKEMCENPISESSAEQIQNIIFFLQQSEGLSKHVDDFKEILSLMQYKDFMSFVLTPWLPLQMHEDNFLRSVDSKQGSEENEADAILAELKKEVSMGDILKELGYGCTSGSAHCKEIFSRFSPLDEVTIAKILGTIINCHTGLEDNQSTLSFLESALDFKISNDLSPLSSWDIDVLVHTIKELAPYTDWVGVIENLDHEGFYVPDEEAFSFFMSLYRHACQDPFPLHAICKSVWRNSEGQVSILKYAVLAPPEVFTFAHSRRQLEYNKAALDHKIQVGNANHAWLCLDLLDVLCQLAERGHASAVRSMVGLPLRDCPEILLLGMSRIKTAYNLLQNEISLTVFPMLVKNPSSSDMILYLWHVNPNLVLRGILVIYNTEPECLIRILDVCQELKILSPVLDMIPSTAGIRLAVIVSRKGLIDLEKWLANNLIAYKDLFFEECLNFLKENQLGRSRDVSVKPFEPTNAVANHNNETRFTFMKVLKEHVGLITSTELPKEMERLHIAITDSGPNLRNGGSGGDSTNADGFPEDVEAEASSFFHQLYFGQMEVDAVIQMLGRFKESSVKKEQLIFECMIANLFEEYKFFPKYPEKQLKIAAILFGSIIKHQLVTRLTLGIALRTILDALRKPPDSKMFVFATKALEQFVERMIEWPQYCNHILQISHMRSTHPELVAFIERALARISSGHLDSVDSNSSGFYSSGLSNSSSALGALNGINVPRPGQPLSSSIQQPRNENPLEDRLKVSMASTPTNDIKPLLFSGPQNASSGPYIFSSTGSVRPFRGVSSTRFGSALNIETLVAAAESREKPIEAPASEIQDKVSFIINNISTANMEAKAKEFIDVSNEQYYPWFAQYMVMKRASIEPNFHDLYLKFLDKINSKALIKEIVQATYENCKVLLGSELIKSSSEERSLLKNLGSWLGKLTIGRNQVLRAREIDPKSLIIEAYEKGLMIAVIPFTSKIMEPCQSSLAYQTPNPWTMGILGLLAEIYLMPNLKMNLKFDIEVLFKNLGVDMKDISPTSLLKHRKRQIEGNPDFSNKDVGSIQTQAMNHVELPIETGNAPNAGGDSNLLSQYTAPIPLSSSTLLEDEKLAALGLSDRLPTAQGHFQATPSQSPFSVSQLPTAMPNVGTHVIINQKLHSWGLDVQFQRVVPIVMDRAIKEIVNGIVQRSVSIATQTTKELVLKDYAMETDETRIYNAAHLMVASLAGSLAHVTCKEPLRTSISSQLINLLQGSSNLNELLEHAVQLATNDNLDLGCAIIEQAATDKAIQTIDAQITQQLSIRRKHGDGVGSTFFGADIFAQGSVGVVPESLRPKPGHLSLSQQRVYEDFVRLPWQNQSSQSMHMGISTSSSASSLANTYGSVAGQLNVGYSSASTNESEAVSRSLDKASETIEPSSSAFLRCSSSSSLQNEPAVGVAEHSGSYSLSASNSSKALEPELYADAFTLVKELGVPLLRLSTSAAAESIGSSFAEASLSTRDALDKYQIISQKLETLMSSDAREPELQDIIAEVPDIILKCVSRDEAALAVAQKVFKGLYEDASNDIHVNPSLAILAAIRDVCTLVVKELTSWVIYSDEDRKFNKDITLGLIHHELLNLGEYNVHMAKLIDGGRNKAATAFVITLIQALIVEDSKFIAELHNLVDALAKIASKPGTPESLQQLVEIVKNPAASSAGLSAITSEKEDKERHSGDTKPANEPSGPNEDYSSSEPVGSDPAGFREQVSMLFIEWCRTCELPGSNDSTHFILQLYHNGLLKGDDMTDCFFRILTDASVAHCLTTEVRNPGAIQASQQAQNLSFFAIDHYARLVLTILKVEHGSSKLLLLSKILDVTVRCILKDSEEKNTSFNPRPYFRLFINWLLDLVSLDPVVDSANYQMLTAFANTFHALQPMKLPAFSFAWLELVSHRSFMPKLLTGNALKGWGHAKQLLVDLFQFLEPFLRNAELGVPVHFLYKGTLKVLLLLLHDFPEFLCDYHFAFCDVIPPSCIQMRNIILGAFPCNKRLPDPSTPNLKIDLLPEIREPPRVLSEVDTSLKANQMKTDVDEYLRTRQQGSSFLTDLKQRLLLPPSEAAASGTLYNVPLINSLVLYAGMQAIQSLPESHGPSGTMVMVDAAMDIYQTLVVDLDTEGRYLFLNAVANQLRYPNNHTHYFSFILLFLFSEASQEIIQEQITRVLLERLIATRPHPWGLLITFIELIKNPRYSFWSRSFIRCAPEIEKLFESVARSCSGKPMDDSTVRG